MKTIFFTIYDSDTEKNLLQSNILEILQNAGHQIVLLVKENRLDDFQKYTNKNVLLESLPNAYCFSERVYFWLGRNVIPTYSMFMKRRRSYMKHSNLFRYKLEQFISLLGKLRLFKNFLRLVYYHIPDDYGKTLFDKYNPDLLFAPNMFSYEDGRLLRYAKKHGVRTVTTTKSWDVLTNKAFTKIRANKILVQNKIIKRDAIKIGDYKEEQIKVVGFPQFDLFADKSILLPREEFFKGIGADPKRKLILYSTSGDWKNPYDDEVVLGIHQAIENGNIKQPAQILARFHPKFPSSVEKLNLPYLIKDRPGIVKDKADWVSNNSTSSDESFIFSFGRDDLIHLANTLYYSDVTINTMSTIVLDAAVFDKPIILIKHDGLNRRLDYWHSIRKAYDEEHYKNIMHIDAARVSEAMEDTIHYINAYLDDPSLDHEKREILRKEILFKLDGRAGERIANEILSSL